MKTLLLCQSDAAGGAARAAFRLHKTLLKFGVDSRMRVGLKTSDLTTIDGPRGKLSRAIGMTRPYVGGLLMRLQKSHNPVLHSPAILPSGAVKNLNKSSVDVLHLHWINNEFLSIEDIGRLRKPLVWTLHDMWAFCGAEHYSSDDAKARWRTGYRADNRPEGHQGLDMDCWVSGRKRRSWLKPIHIVTPSRWLGRCVKGSALMRDWPVTVIPNPLDTSQYQPWPKKQARELLGLPLDAPLVLFGALGGGKDPRKGWDLLQPALTVLSSRMPGVEGVIFGESEPNNPPRLGLRLHWLGPLHDDVTLALVYSAADVMVVPSTQENLPQSGTEAHACGCPVVAFNATGLPDVVEHKVTGYLAKAFVRDDLANGIRWVLEDKVRYSGLSVAARDRALRLWSPDVVAAQYLALYKKVSILHHEKGD